MNFKVRSISALALTITILILTSVRLPADTGTCGGVTTTVPFTDVTGNLFFCQIAEAFFSGLTNGTTPTTYSPSDSVPREQMAAFITRTQDAALTRGNRRAALKQWATPFTLPATGRTALGSAPRLVESDGIDLWVAETGSGDVKRVRGADGSVLGTWTGAGGAWAVLVARGRVFVAGNTNPGRLYVLDPSDSPGQVTLLSSTLGDNPLAIATDGRYIWTANGISGTLSRVDPDTGTTLNFSGFSAPAGILFDGANLWVTDSGILRLDKVDSSGVILLSVPVGAAPQYPVFDGANIWVPNRNRRTVMVVRARDGMVLADLQTNANFSPLQAAFDGQRVLVTSADGNMVAMWKATDLTPLGIFSTVTGSPYGACSDGINFWIVLSDTSQLARF